MKIRSHIVLDTAALATAALLIYLNMSGPTVPPPAPTAVSAASAASPVMPAAAPAAPRKSGAPPEELMPVDDHLSATGMEYVPVFD